jgi:hypothetical protein
MSNWASHDYEQARQRQERLENRNRPAAVTVRTTHGFTYSRCPPSHADGSEQSRSTFIGEEKQRNRGA